MPEPTLYQRKVIDAGDFETEIETGWIYGGSDERFDYYWVPVERPLYEIDRKALDPYWNSMESELAKMIEAGYIRQVAGLVGIGGDDEG